MAVNQKTTAFNKKQKRMATLLEEEQQPGTYVVASKEENMLKDPPCWEWMSWRIRLSEKIYIEYLAARTNVDGRWRSVVLHIFFDIANYLYPNVILRTTSYYRVSCGDLLMFQFDRITSNKYIEQMWKVRKDVNIIISK